MKLDLWFRRFLDLPENELKESIHQLSRDEIINWLCWNDKNGIYRDKDSLAEFGNMMTLEEGREIMIRQILQG
ncbi:hypothetical protein [Mongoliibacter ruber]|uniref:Uncharacterized protein n=1 Tax=Mongoliibacter ruber TaxID=1750599 RepID=A0A2T0WT07_9BACT|nr:hypothetical protein [Mongoliibacter ruber]PRY89832.1 hypothetical protein CLW00_102308 [Mongoliibacter ruber]